MSKGQAKFQGKTVQKKIYLTPLTAFCLTVMSNKTGWSNSDLMEKIIREEYKRFYKEHNLPEDLRIY